MSWYGESYALDDGTVITGPDFDIFRLYYHFDDQTHTFTAGDAVLIGSYADPQSYTEFMAFADMTVRWVVEVTGGAGVLNLSAGVDPTWSYDNVLLADQDLGSYTVSGPTTIVSPPMTIADMARYKDNWDSVVLLLECSSGSVEVQQVKTRVWPTAGPSGAWTAGPSYTGTSYANCLGMQEAALGQVGATDRPTAAEAITDAHALSLAALEATDPGPYSWTYSAGAYGSYSYTATRFAYPDGSTAFWRCDFSQRRDGPMYLSATPPPVYGPPPGVDWGRDPKEISSEGVVRASESDREAPLGTFAGWSGSLNAYHQGDGFGVISFVPQSGPPDFTPVTFSVFHGMWEYEVGGGSATVSGSVYPSPTSIPVSGPQYLAITARPDVWETGVTPGAGADFKTGGSQTSVSAAAVSYLVEYSGYEYFDPALPWVDDTPPEPAPSPSGYYIIPNPNLDGEGNGVQVYFASS